MGKRSGWWALLAVLVLLHVLAWLHAERMVRTAEAGRAELLLEALVKSAEQTLQASHYLEERVVASLRTIAQDVAAHPEWRTDEELRRLAARHDLKAVAVYDGAGHLVAAGDRASLAAELPPGYGCHGLLHGGQTEHVFGFSQGIFCETDAFGFASRLPEGGLVRVLADVGFVLGFERSVGLPALVERFREHPDVAALVLVDPAGRPLLPGSSGGQNRDPPLPAPNGVPLSDERARVRSRALILHGKPAGRFELVLADRNLAALRRTAGMAIGASGLLSALALWLWSRRSRRLEEIEDRERQLQEMTQRSEGLARVVAGVAHEIRNPLNTLALGLEGLRAGVQDVPRSAGGLDERFDLLQGTVAEANRLVQDLLQSTRPILPQMREIATTEWAGELLAACRAAFPNLRCEWRSEGVGSPQGNAPLALVSDPILLRRLAWNLIQNSAQAGARTVVLTPRDGGREFHLAFQDDGPGLPAAVRRNLFLPGNTNRPDGSGLGLYNAWRLAAGLGGGLTLGATGEAGTRFDLVLPRREGEKNAT